jgi:hypothetical protein
LKVIDFIIRIIPMLSNVKITGGTHRYSLDVVVTICIDVTFDTVELWIVVRNGPVWVHAEYFAFISALVLGGDLTRCG